MRWKTIVFISLFLASATAHAEEWNVFTSCLDASFSANERAFREQARQCDQGVLAEVYRSFAAPPLADVAGEGGQAVRVTITDGYGRRTVVVEAFQRAGTPGAFVTARGMGDGERRAPESMQAELERDAWDAISRRAMEQARARAVSPLPAWRERQEQEVDGNESIAICLHGWSVIIETFGFGQARVLQRNACDDEADATFDFGWRAMRYVFSAFNDCDGLDQQFFRNDAARLSFCLGLSGEIAVAASATNALQPFMYDALASPRMRYLLADDFALSFDGEEAVSGADAAYARWSTFVAGDYELGFDTAVGSVDNEWRQSAQLSLLLFDDAASTVDRTRFAEVLQTWRREDDLWLLQSTQVGPWQSITTSND